MKHSGDRAWADFDASGNVLARYLYGEMGTDHLLARQRPGEGTVWYLGDRQGTVRDLADASGVIINTIRYDSFGNIVNETNPAAGDRFKYTGREFEAVIGLYYYRARWYDPQQGRFIHEDTWGLAAGDPNFYRYVFNAPGQWTDPSGHLAITEFGAELILGALSAFLGLDIGCINSHADVPANQDLPLEGGVGRGSSGNLQIEVLSCARLLVTANANATFAVVGATLAYRNLTAGGQPIDCVEFKSEINIGAFFDYTLLVRVGCTGGDNKATFGAGVDIMEAPQMAWSGLKETYNRATDFGNCFPAGMRIWVWTPPREASGISMWIADNRWLAAVSLAIGFVSAIGIRRKRKRDEDKRTLDQFFTKYGKDKDRDEPSPWEEDPFEPMPVRGHGAGGGATAVLDAPAPARIEEPLPPSKPQPIRTPTKPPATRSWLARNWLAMCVFNLFAGIALAILGIGEAAPPAEPAYATKNIEDITEEDWVMAWNEETGEIEPRQVVQLFRNTSDHLRIITIENADGTVQTIRTTDGHPFWVVDEGWVHAGDLLEGDEVLHGDGTVGTIAGSEYEEHPEGVAIYNFEVEGWHTYFAGQANDTLVLVHNWSRRIPGVRGGKFAKWFDNLSSAQLAKLWRNASCRKTIASRLRHPGGMHEWHLVSRTPVFKKWGIKAETIRSARSEIKRTALLTHRVGTVDEGQHRLTMSYWISLIVLLITQVS